MSQWIPCSGLESVDGLVWIKRMMQKGRRWSEGRRTGTDLLDGYLFGESDFVDCKVIGFLRSNNEAVIDAIRAEPDDVRAAQKLIAASGRSPEEICRFSDQLRKEVGNFMLMEADEGRLPPGLRTSMIRFVYNRLLMPIFYRQYRTAERHRAARAVKKLA